MNWLDSRLLVAIGLVLIAIGLTMMGIGLITGA